MRRQLPDFLNVPWNPREAVNVFITSWLLVPVVLAISLRVLASQWGVAQGWVQAFANGDLTASFIFSLATSLLGLGVVAYYLRKHEAGWHDVGLRKFRLGQALAYLVITVGIFLVSIPILFAIVKILIPGFNADQAQTNEFTQPGTATSAIQLSFLALVIIPPIVEEVIFRGFIFPAMSKRWGVVIGAVLTSLLFGFAHLQANVGVYTIVLSLILCLMYVRLRSIIPGIALHMLNNYLAFISQVHK